MSVELHNALCGYCRRKLWESSQHQHVQLGTTACQTGSIQVMANTPVNKDTTSAHLKEKKTFTPKCRSYLLSNKEAAHNRTDKFQWFPSVKEKERAVPPIHLPQKNVPEQHQQQSAIYHYIPKLNCELCAVACEIFTRKI